MTSSADFEKALDNEEFLTQLYGDLDKIDANVSDQSEVLGAAVGAGLGAAASFAALYGLGTVGLSAAGITSGLAAAGAVIGGGMVAGVFVLAAPIAALGVAGYALFNYKKKQRVKELQQNVLAKAVSKQNQILQALQNKSSKNESVLNELHDRNVVLTQIINGLRKKLS